MSKWKSLSKLVFQPRKMAFVIMSKGPFKWISDKMYLSILFYLRFGYKMPWNNPKSYNEKLQVLKLRQHHPDLYMDVDKAMVREKIAKTIGPKYLVPIIGCYDSPEEIDFESLPERFVLKCTHGTHCSIVCRNKKDLNISETKRKLSCWLHHNYYYDAREWPYKDVKPRILCEHYIADKNDELIDYKFLCYDGTVRMILVHNDIGNEKGNHTLDLYTPEWKRTDIEWGIPQSQIVMRKPDQLDECIEISEKLSRGYPHVRVDLYIVNEKVYFGELTYYTAAGLKPFSKREDDELLGSWIHLGGKK